MWNFLFLQGFLVVVLIICECDGGGEGVGADSVGWELFDCSNGLLKCDSYGISLSEFLNRGPTELRRKCRSIEAFLDCMEEAAWRCEQADMSQAVEAFIKSGEFFRRLCIDHDNELKKSFLYSTTCISKHKSWTDLSCKPENIYKNVTAFYPPVDASCQYQKALLECRRKSIDKQCGKEVGDFYALIMKLELNLDYLCVDEINTRAPHTFMLDVIGSFIVMLIDFIRPILHFNNDFYHSKGQDTFIPELEKVSQLWTMSEMEKLTETCEDEEDCSQSREVPQEKTEMNFNDFRRYGTIPILVAEELEEELKVHFNAKLKEEILTLLKSYKAALTEFAEFHRAAKERPISEVDDCDEEECGFQRSDSLHKKSDDYRTSNLGSKPTGANMEEIGTLINDLETKVGSKFIIKPRRRETVDLFGESKEESELKINYVLIGDPYLPLETSYSDADQDYSHADEKLFHQRFLLTPITKTIPHMAFEDAIGSLKVMSGVASTEEWDKKSDLNLADEMTHAAPEETEKLGAIQPH